MHLIRRGPSRLWLAAQRNRLELIKAGFGRPDLFRMGLLTAGGYLVAERDLSSRTIPSIGPPHPAAVAERDGARPTAVAAVHHPIPPNPQRPVAPPGKRRRRGRTECTFR